MPLHPKTSWNVPVPLLHPKTSRHVPLAPQKAPPSPRTLQEVPKPPRSSLGPCPSTARAEGGSAQLGCTPGAGGTQNSRGAPLAHGRGEGLSTVGCTPGVQGGAFNTVKVHPWSWEGAQHSRGAAPAWGAARQGLSAPRLLRDVCECFSAAEPSEPVKQDIKGRARRGSPGPPRPASPCTPKRAPRPPESPRGQGAVGSPGQGHPARRRGPSGVGGSGE